MVRIALLFVVLVFGLMGCNNKSDAGTEAAGSTKIRHPLFCMAKALRFYATGGDVFNEPGFKVSAVRVPPGYADTRREDNVVISVHDTTTDNRGQKIGRTMRGEFPAAWLDVNSAGYATLAGELKTFGDFFDRSAQRQQDTAKNPLNKPQNDDSCYYGALNVNGIQGSFLNCAGAPHFQLQLLPER